MRSRMRWGLLAVLFVGVPLAELYVLIQVGQVIGAGWTILLLLADGVFGSWLIKHEGRRAWQALRAALDAHEMPARELADGALILTGGTLMLTPGFLSDVVGLLLILPFTRPFGRRILAGFVTRKLLAGSAAPGPGPGGASGRRRPSRAAQRPGPDGVVRGEVID